MYEAASEPPVTNSACKVDPTLLWLRKKNSELTINRLPPEILSHILLIGVEFDRKVWRWESPNARSQDIASHVCHHWREVAIGNPSLWTLIHINGPPNKYTALCITRAGGAFLDILINMFPLVPYPNYPYDPIRGTQPTTDILQFLTKHSAGAHRWRTLFVRFPESDLLPIFIGYLNTNSPTHLRLLRFECANWMFRDVDYDNLVPLEYKSEGILQAHDKSRTLLECSVPKLQELELISISAPYVFTSKPIVALSTLRTLSIAPSSPYSVDLANLLLSNPQLESLYLQGGYYYGSEARMGTPDRDLIWPVVLPSLRTLHLGAVDNARWVIDMLSTIKAPMLHHLGIQSFNQFTFGGEQRERLVSYLATGGDVDYLQCGNRKSPCTPIYSSIRSLNVFHFPCKKKEFMRLMGSLPQLTHLTARSKQAEWLGAAPWILPELELLEVPQLTTEAAVKLLRQRSEAGTPIDVLKTQEGCLRFAGLKTKASDVVPRAIPGYEYQDYNRGTGVSGDWESIRGQSEEFKKEHEDRLEYDLEEDRYDSLFDDD